MEKETPALELLGKKIQEQDDTMGKLEHTAESMALTIKTICEMVADTEKVMIKQQEETEALTDLIIELGIEAGVLDDDIRTLDISTASMVILKATDVFRGES